jgi:hypothetical protein
MESPWLLMDYREIAELRELRDRSGKVRVKRDSRTPGVLKLIADS